MPICPRTPLLRLALVASSLFGSAAWGLAPASRIATVGAVANTPVAHSVSARAKAATDLGPAPADHQLQAVTLNFSRSAAQQAALDQLLLDQQNPSSPKYRKWLTPLQFKAQFGLSDADVAKVATWLTSQGLTVTTKSLTNTYIIAEGSVAQVEKAFGVSMRSVSVQGESHITNVTDPQLPAAIANVVTGITGLSDILPKPRAVLRKVPKPQYTTSAGAHYITPADYNTIYDLAPLGAAAINGTGVTIAVMGQTAISLTDVAAFRTASGLTANVPVISYNPASLGTSQGDLPEAQLDVEWSGAIAPNATIEYVAYSAAQNGAFGALINSIAGTSTPAPLISISYGECEPGFSQADIYAYDQYFQQANVQGQTILGPGGDSGATDCDYALSTATDGLAVDFPGSSPHVTSVGGTMFNEGSGSYWSTSNGAGGSSALSYIPEVVWNESSSLSELSAGGGGRSIFFTKPSWQVGAGVPADSVRDTPDIALAAGVNNDGFLICSAGSCTNNGFADSSGNYDIVGGTSVGVPSFSGILALVEQKIGHTAGLGNVNPTLYGLAGSSAASVYHDIVSGNNNSACAIGSPDCSSSSLTEGYSASAGYDLATGWGSVDGNNLANLWANATPTANTSTTGSNLSVTAVSLPSGTASCGIASGSVSFTVGVAASTETTTAVPTAVPTGTVQLFVDGVLNSGSVATLSNGTATLTLNTAALSSGSHTIAVAYSGDATYASSRGNLAPTLSPAASNLYVPPSTIDVVSSTSPDFTLTPCLPTLAVSSGSSATVTMTATALNGFSGPVTFTATTDSALYGYASLSFSASPVTVSTSTAGTSVLTVNALYTTTSSNVRRATARVNGGDRPGGISRRGLYGTGAGTAALASLLFLVLPRRRRYVGLFVLVLSAAAFGVSGCGSGATPIPASTIPPTTATTGTPAGYYVINVTASGTNSAGARIAHTSSLTLQVTQ